MPADEDKYPAETGRRRFVKGVVGSATLASVAAGTAAAINTATSPGGLGGGTTEYVGIENTDGPAPRGMPMIPVRITDDGELTGLWPEVSEREEAGRTIQVAEQDVGGVTYSSTWFQYCGVQQYTGAQPAVEAESTFQAKPGSYEWMSDMETGQVLTVEDFADYREWGNGIGRAGLGKPAGVNWRVTEEGRALPVQVMRTPELPRMINGEGKYSAIPGPVREFLEAATEQNFMAWLNKCTHFCCVPGFKTSTYQGAGDAVYCQCHQSIYDPFNPVQLQFVALPRPEEA